MSAAPYAHQLQTKPTILGLNLSAVLILVSLPLRAFKGILFLLLSLSGSSTLNPEPFNLGFTHLQPPYP